MTEATRGLKVTIVQSTSDECGALAKHAKQGLEAHHSPDLFHVQHEVVKATSLPMASRVRAAEKRLEEVAGHRAGGGAGPGLDPARPFLRPALKVFRKGAQRRFLDRVAGLLGWGRG